MQAIDYSKIGKLHALARRDRAQHIYCLVQQAPLWIRARFSGDGSQRTAPCR